MNKKVIILWCITIFCLVMTVVFFVLSRNVEVDYEEFKFIVTNTSSRTVTSKRTITKTSFFDVTF